ncbi:MAG: FAD-dependent oxidoreductase [Phycisphaerales bacterium]|nr:FAD-dependent oxidoreductase [Phycisphaerales bacterium]
MHSPTTAGSAAEGNDPSTFDVIVVGAGLAGLHTARTLRLHGLRVLVLEARDRVGGRVHSVTLETGTRVDLGAQLISDRQKRITALAREAGVQTRPSGVPGLALHVTADGVRRLPPGRSPASLLGQLDAAQALWRCDRAVRRLNRRNPAKLDRLDGIAFIRSLTCLGDTRRLLSQRIETDLCTPLAGISAFELLDQLRSMGGMEGAAYADEHLIVSGATGLIEHLAAGIEPVLLLNAPVTAVEQDDRGVSVEAAGGRHRARRVVLAVPPSIIRGIRLTPQLPADRRAALDGFTAGRIIKTVVEFPSAWWRSLGLSGEINSPGDRFGAAIDGTPPGSDRGVLVAFTSGPAAQAAAAAPAQQRINQLTEWLGQLTGTTAPSPLAARSMDWFAEPFSLGGYASRRSPGAWSACRDLFAPAGRIHFAGTETATVWRSYMEGALESAERAAEEVLSALRPAAAR